MDLDQAQILKEYWPILSAFFGLIAWSLRLEAKVLSNEKDLNNLGKKVREQENTITTDLKKISVSIAHIEGYMLGKKEGEKK